MDRFQRWVRGACLFISACAGSAAAAEGYLIPIEVPGWEGGSIDNSDNGSADFCQIGRYDDAGNQLLAIWFERGLILGISSPNYKMTSGQPYEMELNIDERTTTISGRANSEDTFVALIGTDRSVLDAFKTSAMMQAVLPMGSMVLDLVEAAAAFEALEDCYLTEIMGEPAKYSGQMQAEDPLDRPAAGLLEFTYYLVSPPHEDGTPDCPGGFEERMSFTAPLAGGEIVDFSYSFQMRTRFPGQAEGSCTVIERSGTLVEGLSKDGRLELTVHEVLMGSDTPQEVRYRGQMIGEHTAEIYCTDAPFDPLLFDVETLR